MRNTSPHTYLLACVAALLLAAPPADAGIPSRYADRDGDWHRSDEGRRIAENVLTWQSPRGGWPKNGDTASEPYAGDRDDLDGTFDNRATTGELRFLARAAKATRDRRYYDALLKGLDHVLEAQYDNGGWPQFYPPGKGYHRHITFNDDVMVRLLKLVRDVAGSDDFAFVDQARRDAAQNAFVKGIRCILDCQIVVDGRRTAWCAQHDETDLRPRPARAFEHASLSGGESAGILLLLMSIDEPGREIRQAVHAGARWFASAQITGIKVERVDGDRVVVQDPDAEPLWARFYEIETNRPIFVGRDGVRKYRLAEIDHERRNGYAWYGNWGEDVAQRYEQWKRR